MFINDTVVYETKKSFHGAWQQIKAYLKKIRLNIKRVKAINIVMFRYYWADSAEKPFANKTCI